MHTTKTISGKTSDLPSTGLRGNYRLDRISVDVRVNLRSPGVYAVGSLVSSSSKRPWASASRPSDVGTVPGNLSILYVGRSDDDLRKELARHVGHYEAFQFEFYPNDVAAFDKECHLYHAFGGAEGKLDNTSHPLRPKRFPRMSCPLCGAG